MLILTAASPLLMVALGLGGFLAALLKRAKAGAFSFIIFLLASGALLAALLWQMIAGAFDPFLLLVTAGGGLIALGLGALVNLLERRQEEYEPEESVGYLLVGNGILAIVATLMIPALPSQFQAEPARPRPTQIAEALTDTPTPTPTAPPDTFTPSPRPTATASPTRKPSPTPRYTLIPTWTPITPTLTPSITPTPRCLITSDRNMNLRAGPGTEFERLEVLDAGEGAALVSVSASGEWYQIAVNGQLAWIYADFVQATGICDDAPVFEPSPTPRFTATPTATATLVPGETPSPAASAEPFSATAPDCVAIANVDMNVRGGPSTGDRIVGTLDPGDQVGVIGRQGEWWHVMYNGLEAWTFAPAMTTTGSCAQFLTPVP